MGAWSCVPKQGPTEQRPPPRPLAEARPSGRAGLLLSEGATSQEESARGHVTGAPVPRAQAGAPTTPAFPKVLVPVGRGRLPLDSRRTRTCTLAHPHSTHVSVRTPRSRTVTRPLGSRHPAPSSLRSRVLLGTPGRVKLVPTPPPAPTAGAPSEQGRVVPTNACVTYTRDSYACWRCSLCHDKARHGAGQHPKLQHAPPSPARRCHCWVLHGRAQPGRALVGPGGQESCGLRGRHLRPGPRCWALRGGAGVHVPRTGKLRLREDAHFRPRPDSRPPAGAQRGALASAQPRTPLLLLRCRGLGVRGPGGRAGVSCLAGAAACLSRGSAATCWAWAVPAGEGSRPERWLPARAPAGAAPAAAGEVTSDQGLSLSFLFCTMGTMTDCASESFWGSDAMTCVRRWAGLSEWSSGCWPDRRPHLLHEDAVPRADLGSAASPDPEAQGLPTLPSLGAGLASIPGGDTVLAATPGGEACWC